jgi:hypothetical protein
MARHLPPDHAKGDERTLGGYMAVHGRPPAFEGVDGMSYTVAIATDDTGDPARPVGGFLVFVCWGRGEPAIAGHVESDFLDHGESEEAARAALGAMPLADVKRTLDALIRAGWNASPGERGRPWWEAMRDGEGGGVEE